MTESNSKKNKRNGRISFDFIKILKKNYDLYDFYLMNLINISCIHTCVLLLIFYKVNSIVDLIPHQISLNRNQHCFYIN